MNSVAFRGLFSFSLSGVGFLPYVSLSISHTHVSPVTLNLMCTYPGCALILTTAAELVSVASAAVGPGSNARVGASLFDRNSLQYVRRPSVLSTSVCCHLTAGQTAYLCAAQSLSLAWVLGCVTEPRQQPQPQLLGHSRHHSSLSLPGRVEMGCCCPALSIVVAAAVCCSQPQKMSVLRPGPDSVPSLRMAHTRCHYVMHSWLGGRRSRTVPSLFTWG